MTHPAKPRDDLVDMHLRLPTGILVCAAVCLQSCAVATSSGGFVHHGREGQVARVRYVEATPAPGTTLREGERQVISVTVAYMMLREHGYLVLGFRDGAGNEVLQDEARFIPIQQTRTQTITIAQEVLVPRGSRGLGVRIGVAPSTRYAVGGAAARLSVWYRTSPR